jgi:tetratricopeptide (TPR) repeat protein
MICPLNAAVNYTRIESRTTKLDLNRSQSDATQTMNESSMIDHLKLSFNCNDLVRCRLICRLSNVKYDSYEVDIGSVKQLGLISSEELPLHYQSIQYLEKEKEKLHSFTKYLEKEKGFNNPAYIDIISKKVNLKVFNNYSLMNGLYDIRIDEKETATHLRKQQNRNLALKNVERGIHLVKENKSVDALLCYNKALSIDVDNVEAYVARGALYANDGHFDKSISDLKAALQIEPNHENGRKYLKEVYIAYAVNYEKKLEFENATVYLKKSLQIDPNNEQIKAKLCEVIKKVIFLSILMFFFVCLKG